MVSCPKVPKTRQASVRYVKSAEAFPFVGLLFTVTFVVDLCYVLLPKTRNVHPSFFERPGPPPYAGVS